MEKAVQYRHKTIHYRLEGKGPLVLLLHGFGEDHSVWEEQIRFLKNRFLLVLPDLPGSGKSEPAEDMSIDGLAEAMQAVLEAVWKEEGRQEKVNLIGHSMGGYIALAYLEKFPQYLNSLGLFHSTSYADTEEKKATRRKGIQFIRDHGPFEFLKTTIPNLFSPLSRQRMAAGIEDFTARQRNFSAGSLVSYYEAMIARPDRRRLLKNNALPFLFVMGKHDMAVPFSDGLAQCHLPDISYIHILRRSGHMGMMEEPEAVNRIMQNFLTEVQSQP